MSVDYVELRLYADSTAASYVLLPAYTSLNFDVKYNDASALSFEYPLVDAKALGLKDQSLVGAVCGFSDGTSREVERYVIEGTDDTKVSDDERTVRLTGRGTLGVYMEDATVYPSNWKTPTPISKYTRAANVATLTVPTGHGYNTGQKIYVSGVDPTFDGAYMLTAAATTTVSYMSLGVDVASTNTSTGVLGSVNPSGHEFVSSTVGTIMRTLMSRAKSRGCFPFIDETSFSASSDSNGLAWNATHTQQYSSGTSYFQVLRDFMDRGYIDAFMSGNALKILNGGTRGKHVSIGNVELRPAQNVSEMTTATKSGESASVVLIEGEEGTAVERTNPTFQTTIGRRRERYVQQGGIADAGVLTLLGDAELNLYSRIPTEETLGVSNVGLTPFLDFDIADWVWVRYDTTTASVERRVRQIAVSVDANGAVVLGLTLNTILYEQDVALQRRMDSYSGGGNSTGYGSQPTDVDTTVPVAPAGLQVTTGYFIDSAGQYGGAFTAQWLAPTLNADGTQVNDLDHYEVTWQYQGDTVWSPTYRTSSTETSLGYSPVTPGRTIVVQVRAVDHSGNTGPWTAPVTATVVQDTTGPNAPSKPTVLSKVQRIDVTWDGLDIGALPMPQDFDRIEIWQSGNPTFTPAIGDAVLVGTLRSAGTFAAPGLADNQDTYYRFRSVDKAKNVGGTSAVSAVAQKLPIVTSTAPTAPPAAPYVVGGVGVLLVSWPPTTGSQVNIQVHMSTNANFTPALGDAATKIGDSVGSAFVITKTASGGPLDPNATYYVRLIAYNPALPGGSAPSPATTASLRQITGPDIAVNAAWVGTMTADRLTAGDLTVEMAIKAKGGVVATGAAGEEVAMRSTGFTVTGATSLGKPKYIDFPTTGAPNIISGTLQATTLEVAGDKNTGKAMSLFKTSELAAGATLKINSKVASPAAQPVAVLEYPETMTINDLAGTTMVTQGGHGGFYSAGKLWTVSSVAAVSLVSVDPTTGNVVDVVNLATKISDLQAALGATKIGTTLYVLYLQTGSSTVVRMARLDATTYAQIGSSVTVYTINVDTVNSYHGAVGTDGTKLLLGYYRKSDGVFIIKALTDLTGFTGGTTYAFTALTFAGVGDTPVGLSQGTFDQGAARFIIHMRGYNFSYTTAATPVRMAAEDWNSPSWQSSYSSQVCCVWDGTYWRHITEDKRIGRYSPLTWGTLTSPSLSNVFWSTTKYDNVAGVETDQSPRYQTMIVKRMAVRVTASLTGAPQARIYLGQTDTLTAMQRQSAVIALPAQAVLLEAVDLTSPATLNPPATSAFGDNPASIQSTDGGSYWYGDNTAKFLQLVVASNVDADTTAGNKPALRVGDIAGIHLRVDGNEIIAMTGDTAQGELILNKNGPAQISGMIKNNIKPTGTLVANTDKTVSVSFVTPFPASGPVPTVTATPSQTGLGNPTDVTVNNITRSGFDLIVRRGITAGVDIHWQAIASLPS